MTVLYLDHNATTPLDPEARAEMEAAWNTWGNPSSIHAAGQAARRIVDRARIRVAVLLAARPEEILFTSGGTEADNLAILGAPHTHLVVSAIEHQAVLHPVQAMEKRGVPVTWVKPGAEGAVEPSVFASALRPETTLASVMLANNNTGVIQPIARMAHPPGVLLHTDAVQAAGKMQVDVRTLGVDLLSISSHKIHGPKGVGALWIRPGTRLDPVLFGGHQERGLRPGTENVPAIAGFGKACELAASRWEADARHMEALRTAFEEAVLARIPGSVVHGRGAPRLPNTAYIGFDGMDGEMLAIHLDLLGVAVSTGAACSTLDTEPSHVLTAMGLPADKASSSVRFSLGRDTTSSEMEQALDKLVTAVAALKRAGP